MGNGEGIHVTRYTSHVTLRRDKTMNKAKSNILVVDDEPDMLETFRSILKKKYRVITSNSGKGALTILKKERVDICLLDIKMPDMDGIEVLKRIKDIDENLEVIMVTALKDVKLAVKAMKLGAFEYINKPFEVDELLALTEKALEKRSLLKENIALKEMVKDSSRYCDLIGKTKPMQDILKLIDDVSETNSTVLITGESGTGKELVARAIHKNSKRAEKPFIVVNCVAIPDNLLESELFGHEKGSFTGAIERKIGKFELADQGTIFLDEIGCMSPNMQAKLLRVLENGSIDRIGEGNPIPLDIRVIAATNIDFKTSIKEKSFREDLYYRLNVIPVHMPSLRKRIEDIPLFVEYFLNKFNKLLNKSVKSLSQEALEALIAYRWPGNVRELQNLIERVVALSKNEIINLQDFPKDIVNYKDPEFLISKRLKGTLKQAAQDFEKDFIVAALREAEKNQTHAARLLGIHRTTLISKMESLGISM